MIDTCQLIIIASSIRNFFSVDHACSEQLYVSFIRARCETETTVTVLRCVTCGFVIFVVR